MEFAPGIRGHWYIENKLHKDEYLVNILHPCEVDVLAWKHLRLLAILVWT
jgi:hypothetical protein